MNEWTEVGRQRRRDAHSSHEGGNEDALRIWNPGRRGKTRRIESDKGVTLYAPEDGWKADLR